MSGTNGTREATPGTAAMRCRTCTVHVTPNDAEASMARRSHLRDLPPTIETIFFASKMTRQMIDAPGTTSDRISIVAKLFVSHSGIETGRSGPHSSSVAGSSSSVARVPRPRCQTGPNSARMSASESACCRAIEAQAHPCHAAAAERNAAPTRPSAPPPQPPRPPVFWQLQPWPQHSNEPRYPQWSLIG